ncbi:glycosyl hydrolase family 28 protein [Coraliomargarita algicola]|uniref:Glycosyl hydrolase family 28 protein n=1 Tax=Coraliomargarita algicola TaxID=3092156 RepID=A0ABZ0RRW5_9BACT|nr:glycosyl hydrolase family 28 protein [Coraliomargarita sp. J2-16]WPJ97838.1 glycosyl hydrolase family 28 protein [Coraliomargarita sp. J2-16]
MRHYNISDYGAVGDGETVNTQAIQRAINACRDSGGGRVCVADGRYITGTIHLYSNIELQIEANATLAASTDGADYPDFDSDELDKKDAPRATNRCLIYIGGAENVSITGMGIIDCNGSAFCDLKTDENGKQCYVRNTDLLPARMIFVMSSKNVNLCNFTMKEMAGGWGCWINNCQYVSANSVKMYCNPDYPNADGIHINCSSDVTISNCIIHSGDDSIIVRANTKTLKSPRSCERISVKGCVLSSMHNAIRIAWRNDGSIQNCTFSDLIITDSRQGLTIELPDHSNPTDFSQNYTQVRNLNFNNIVLDRVTGAPIKLFINPDNLVDYIQEIHFSNITSNSGEFPLVVGRKDAIIKDISFNHCTFNITEQTNESYPIFKNVEGLRLNDTGFTIME